MIADFALDPAADDQVLLAQVVNYYHDTLKTTPEALDYLRRRGISNIHVLDHFRIGYADRSLGLKLPTKASKAGRAIRSRLQQLGLYRESGHEHFRGSVTFPILASDGSGRIRLKSPDGVTSSSTPPSTPPTAATGTSRRIRSALAIELRQRSRHRTHAGEDQRHRVGHVRRHRRQPDGQQGRVADQGGQTSDAAGQAAADPCREQSDVFQARHPDQCGRQTDVPRIECRYG